MLVENLNLFLLLQKNTIKNIKGIKYSKLKKQKIPLNHSMNLRKLNKILYD